MSLSPTDIKTIVESLRASSWDQAVITVGDTRIELARNGKPLPSVLGGNATEVASPMLVDASPNAVPPLPVVDPPLQPSHSPSTQVEEVSSAVPISDSDHVVTSPSVGVFWRAPEPGADSFVEVGQLVKVGDTLGIVEIMKLMSNVSADVNGVVTAVHVDNAGAVEFGTPLVSIKAEA
ncbi:hypothetical protein PV761_21440 [Arthrobacter sp. CC3]|uniref:acetyl-CoA carboxylase biotin carboxyl carrier protein n=1 Tax=Arthrobacter sp. CC3 TaxID=3029185 RepID=UPI003262DF6D